MLGELDEVTIDRLAKLAKIPPDGRERFLEGFPQLLQSAQWINGNWWPNPKHVALMEAAAEAGRAIRPATTFAALERAARELAAAIDGLEPQARELLQGLCPMGMFPVVGQLAQEAKWLAEGARRAGGLSRKSRRKATGLGSENMSGADTFVVALLYFVEGKCGGKLTFSEPGRADTKRRAGSDTLATFLQEIACHLPHGFVPERNRLALLKMQVTKARKQK